MKIIKSDERSAYHKEWNNMMRKLNQKHTYHKTRWQIFTENITSFFKKFLTKQS